MRLDCKYLVSVNTSSGLPLTKHGVPFFSIRFVNISFDYLLNNSGGWSIIPGITLIDEDAKKAAEWCNIPSSTMDDYIKSNNLYKNKFYFYNIKYNPYLNND
jgi:hypothetical protein